MTSEPDSSSGRRPPTIELKATEVRDPNAGAADAAATHVPPRGQEPPRTDTASRTPEDAAPGESSRHGSRRPLKAHAVSAGLGALTAAIVVAGLWLWGLAPPRQAAAPANAPVATAPANAPVAAAPQSDILARLDRIDRSIATRQTEAALPDRVAAVEAEANSLGQSLTLLNRRLDDIAAASENAAKAADAAQAAAATAKAASAAAAEAAVQKSDVEELANRIAALESTVKTLAADIAQRTPGADDRAARLAVAAEALRAAVERGVPYQAELAAVRALGVEAAAPLEPFAASGLPAADALARELAALAPALRQAAQTATGAATFLGRLEDNARHLVRITPVNAPAGNDPAAVLARIEADAARADIAAALNDVAALPDAAKALAADWVKTAQAREAAVAASRRIAAAALAALNKPAAQ